MEVDSVPPVGLNDQRKARADWHLSFAAAPRALSDYQGPLQIITGHFRMGSSILFDLHEGHSEEHGANRLL